MPRPRKPSPRSGDGPRRTGGRKPAPPKRTGGSSAKRAGAASAKRAGAAPGKRTGGRPAKRAGARSDRTEREDRSGRPARRTTGRPARPTERSDGGERTPRRGEGASGERRAGPGARKGGPPRSGAAGGTRGGTGRSGAGGGRPTGRRSDDAGQSRGRPGAPGRRPSRPRPDAEPDERTAGWGGVARRGARSLDQPSEGTASDAWRKAMRQSRPPDDRPSRPPERSTDEWIDEGEIRDEASRAVDRAETGPGPQPRKRSARRPAAPPRDADLAGVGHELAKADPLRGERLAASLKDAARAFERERYQDARKILRRLAERAPGVAAVRELYGLTLYRMGSYRLATKELEAFHTLTRTAEQHPVLADSYRALGRHARVEELWEELRAASPSADLVAEGRIVAAGSLADRGDVRGAITLLEQGKGDPKKPKVHHLRLWYALADLYERAGEVPKARQLFERITRHDPRFADVAARLRSLD